MIHHAVRFRVESMNTVSARALNNSDPAIAPFYDQPPMIRSLSGEAGHVLHVICSVITVGSRM